jgi:hypothetical protein
MPDSSCANGLPFRINRRQLGGGTACNVKPPHALAMEEPRPLSVRNDAPSEREVNGTLSRSHWFLWETGQPYGLLPGRVKALIDKAGSIRTGLRARRKGSRPSASPSAPRQTHGQRVRKLRSDLWTTPPSTTVKVKAAAPYDPLPDSLGLSCLHIVASFHYNLIR